MYNSGSSIGRSKAQMCLHKILHIIITIPPPPPPPPSPGLRNPEDKAFEIDLNVGLANPEDEMDVSQSPVADEGAGLSSVSSGCGGGNDDDDEEAAATEEGAGQKEEECEETKNGVSGTLKGGEKGLMNLLIEAAVLIFGEFENDEKLTENLSDVSTRRRKRKNQCWTEELLAEEEEEDVALPVVRSRGGRTRVLPYKYRDSVLEPLTRFSKTRSSSTTTNVPTRRRSR